MGASGKPKAVVLVSGGLDSTTTLAIAKSEGFDIYALSFDYGQRHKVELEAAERVAAKLGVTAHRTLQLDLAAFGGSALTDDIAVPHHDGSDVPEAGIPVTYVPARNTIFLSIALAWAEVLDAFDIFIGVNAVDYSGYPDCRPEFIEAFAAMANLATKKTTEGSGTLRVHTPLMRLSKPEVIARGLDLGVDYSWTHSCYDPDPQGRSCGSCDSCLLRKRGFAALGMTDPVLREA